MVDIIVTTHAIGRLLERSIDVHEAKKIALKGKVIQTHDDGAIVKQGINSNGKSLIVVTVKSGTKIRIKTAYYENRI